MLRWTACLLGANVVLDEYPDPETEVFGLLIFGVFGFDWKIKKNVSYIYLKSS